LYGFGIRTAFVLVIFTYFEIIILTGKTIEKCVYCNSSKIVYQTRGSLGKYLHYAVGWLTPDADKEKVEKTKKIRCKVCCRKYQKLNAKKEELTSIRKSLIVLNSALLEFRTIFVNNDFSVLFSHVLFVVQPERNVVHIIFRICKMKAFLDCRMVQGVLTVISVERVF
jgi:hypothetical protein